MVKLSMVLPFPAPDEIHDFHLIALTDDCLVESGALQDDDVVFDRDAARIDVELAEQLGDRQRAAELECFAVQSNRHRPGPSYRNRQGASNRITITGCWIARR
jgi:hypothetical protein